MTRAATLILLSIVLTGIVPSTAFAGDTGQTFQVCLRLNRGGLIDLYEVFLRTSGSSNHFAMKGRVVQFANLPAEGAVVGSGYVANGNVVLGWEAFPAGSLPVAAKLGAILSIASLTATGSGYHLTPADLFFFTFVLALLLGPCEPPV